MVRAKPYCNDNDEPQSIEDCYTITPLCHTDNGNLLLDGFTYWIPGLTLSASGWRDFTLGWWDFVKDDVLAASSGSRIYLGFQITDALVPRQHKAIAALLTPSAGIITGGDLPSDDSVAITYDRFDAHRGGPCGMHWGPIPRSASVGNEITTDFGDLLLAMMNTAKLVSVEDTTAQLVAFDHCHGTYEQIVDFRINLKIGSQDSRTEGVGV